MELNLKILEHPVGNELKCEAMTFRAVRQVVFKTLLGDIFVTASDLKDFIRQLQALYDDATSSS